MSRRRIRLAIVGLALAMAAFITLIAAPRSAANPTGSQPGASGALGSVDASARVQAAASGSLPLIGASLSGADRVATPVVTSARDPLNGHRSPGQWPAPQAWGAETAGSGAPLPPGAVASGLASWYDTPGDVASVPWWRAGQDPVRADVCAFPAGTTVCVDGGVWIVGWCSCLQGTPGERAIDLSRHAFAQLADPAVGLVVVQIETPQW